MFEGPIDCFFFRLHASGACIILFIAPLQSSANVEGSSRGSTHYHTTDIVPGRPIHHKIPCMVDAKVQCALWLHLLAVYYTRRYQSVKDSTMMGHICHS